MSWWVLFIVDRVISPIWQWTWVTACKCPGSVLHPCTERGSLTLQNSSQQSRRMWMANQACFMSPICYVLIVISVLHERTRLPLTVEVAPSASKRALSTSMQLAFIALYTKSKTYRKTIHWKLYKKTLHWKSIKLLLKIVTLTSWKVSPTRQNDVLLGMLGC